MKSRVRSWTWLLLLVCTYSYGQIEQFNYKRKLEGISSQWHKIILPAEIFGKVSGNFSDIRIFGITSSNDTIEVPYILRQLAEKLSSRDVNFKTLNVSHSERKYYFTLEVPSNEPVNQIKLDFEQDNFDWRLKLEGSQDQQNWSTIIEDYRILSIKNELTNFQFTKLSFPNSKYRFFRLLIYSKEKVELLGAKVSLKEITEGSLESFPIDKIRINSNNRDKQTEIDIDLPLTVPVTRIKIGIRDSFGYYRPVTIKYLTDSIKTEQGWKFNYKTLATGVLNSIDKNDLQFNSTKLQKLKIIIYNRDNQPLTIDTCVVKGYVYELLARFTKPATYFLAYGNQIADKPEYDIERFIDKIPATLTALKLGDEQTIEKKSKPVKGPLFKNKAWLWAMLVVIILLLGWSSVKMIKAAD